MASSTQEIKNMKLISHHADLADDTVEAPELLRRALEKRVGDASRAGFREGCLFGNLAGEIAETSEICRTAAAESFVAMRDQFARVLERGQREGSVRDDVAASALADLLLNAWEGSLLRMKVDRSEAPLRGCISLILGDFLAPRAR